jgi:hypothetical protein
VSGISSGRLQSTFGEPIGSLTDSSTELRTAAALAACDIH